MVSLPEDGDGCLTGRSEGMTCADGSRETISLFHEQALHLTLPSLSHCQVISILNYMNFIVPAQAVSLEKKKRWKGRSVDREAIFLIFRPPVWYSAGRYFIILFRGRNSGSVTGR